MRVLEPGPAPAGVLETEVLRTPEAFAKLEPEWDRLIEDAGVPHPFVSHTWLRTWWECFGPGEGELRVVVVREDGRLVAAAPMALRRARMCGVPVRLLETLSNDHTPRFEFPVSRRREEVHRLIWDELAGAPADVVALKQFLADSPALAGLRDRAHADGWVSGAWPSCRAPFIRLEPSYEGILERLTGKQRYNVRTRLGSLRALGPVDVEVLSSPAQVAEGLEDGFRLETSGWKRDAGTAIVSEPRVQEFYMRLARRAAEKGWLRLVFLRVGGRRISFNYLLEHDDRLHAVKIGYDPNYRRYAPGVTLLNLVLEDACSRRLAEYDFLGDAEDWKLVWTREVRSHEWLFLFRPGLKGELLSTVKFRVLPRVKGMLGGLCRGARA